MNMTDIDRLLGRLPPQSHKRDLICTAMSAHGERWLNDAISTAMCEGQ